MIGVAKTDQKPPVRRKKKGDGPGGGTSICGGLLPQEGGTKVSKAFGFKWGKNRGKRTDRLEGGSRADREKSRSHSLQPHKAREIGGANRTKRSKALNRTG